MAEAITSRAEDYSQWYTDLVLKSGLADYSPVRGCMVIKPYGFAIWEKMKDILDKEFKKTGHQNAAFPLLIPKSFLSKEAQHVDGFAKECAVVTHYRLKNDPDGDGVIVDPDSKLEEELIVRPTSETIIWDTYRKWINSYRDLPILVNQWANVMRWEMRTRLFLRTSEFFWQEGHTAHATEQEAVDETLQMLEIYRKFMNDVMCVPVITGVKSPSETFPGAINTYTTEGMMQDGKALQMGTSHFLGQNFAKAFDVKFLNKEGRQELVWATSWGVSTRLMGALVMAHSDDDGLVLPPELAPYQVVIIPIFRKAKQLPELMAKVDPIIDAIESAGITVKTDLDEKKSMGWKMSEHELKGVPVSIAIGPRDLENGTVEVGRRDDKTKTAVAIEELPKYIAYLLEEMQTNIRRKALEMRENMTTSVDTFEAFKAAIEDKGGFVAAHWDGTAETEDKIKELTKATIRCIPMNNEPENGNCILTGAPSTQRVLFAKAY